jgi:hypothetical protein
VPATLHGPAKTTEIPARKGSQPLSGSAWTVSGAGWNISSERYVIANQFRYIWQNVSGNRNVSLIVTSQTGLISRAKACLMVRKTFDPTSPPYAVCLLPEAAVRIHHRNNFFEKTVQICSKLASFPSYNRVSRIGKAYTAYASDDGITWILMVCSSVTVASLEDPLMAGMAVTSGDRNVLNATVFENLKSIP